MVDILSPGVVSVIIGVMTGLTLLLIYVAVASGGSRRYTRRLQEVTGRRPEVRAATEEARSLSRRESATPGMDRFFSRLVPRRQALVDRLAKTGWEVSVGQYVLITIGVVLAVAVPIFIVLHLNPLLCLLIGVAVGTYIPHYIVGYMGRRRISNFLGQFPEAIDLMVRALRAGLPISEAIVNAGQEIGDPVGVEFRGIEAGMKLGRDLDSLLWEIARRIAVPEFRFFIIALNVQRETGGNLAETLSNLSDVLRRRRAMKAKVRAMASEARTSTWILGSLPVGVTMILMVSSPTYIAPMFSDVRGLIMTGIAVGMLLLGVAIMVRMGQFEI